MRTNSDEYFAVGTGLVVIVVIALILWLDIFLPPAGEPDGTAICLASKLVGGTLPWLLLGALQAQPNRRRGHDSSSKP